MLDQLERKILKDCCDLNENLTLIITPKDKTEKKVSYRSRFLAMDSKKQFLILDEPSPEQKDTKPLSRGERFEGFFAFKQFRYCFDSVVLGHTKFKLHSSEVIGFVVRLPKDLKDGDKREYFRVPCSMRPPVSVNFQIYKKDSDVPVSSVILEGKPEEFIGDMIDISGGGFSMRAKLGSGELPLEAGDIIKATFRLKQGGEDMEIWCIARNRRKYKATEIIIWGFQFMLDGRNKNINFCRNKIMHFVTERQREMMK